MEGRGQGGALLVPAMLQRPHPHPQGPPTLTACGVHPWCPHRGPSPPPQRLIPLGTSVGGTQPWHPPPHSTGRLLVGQGRGLQPPQTHRPCARSTHGRGTPPPGHPKTVLAPPLQTSLPPTGLRGETEAGKGGPCHGCPAPCTHPVGAAPMGPGLWWAPNASAATPNQHLALPVSRFPTISPIFGTEWGWGGGRGTANERVAPTFPVLTRARPEVVGAEPGNESPPVASPICAVPRPRSRGAAWVLFYYLFYFIYIFFFNKCDEIQRAGSAAQEPGDGADHRGFYQHGPAALPPCQALGWVSPAEAALGGGGKKRTKRLRNLEGKRSLRPFFICASKFGGSRLQGVQRQDLGAFPPKKSAALGAVRGAERGTEALRGGGGRRRKAPAVPGGGHRGHFLIKQPKRRSPARSEAARCHFGFSHSLGNKAGICLPSLPSPPTSQRGDRARGGGGDTTRPWKCPRSKGIQEQGWGRGCAPGTGQHAGPPYPR